MKLIVACDPKGGIGYDNKLPWSNIKGDLPRFKHLTNNQVIVMGRNTYESLPIKPLKNRLNIVVTSKQLELPNGCFAINNIEKLNGFNNCWLIGGAKLINSCWHLITEIHLTRTLSEYTCDTHIDLVYLQEKFYIETLHEHEDHTYEIWKRR